MLQASFFPLQILHPRLKRFFKTGSRVTYVRLVTPDLHYEGKNLPRTVLLAVSYKVQIHILLPQKTALFKSAFLTVMNTDR